LSFTLVSTSRVNFSAVLASASTWYLEKERLGMKSHQAILVGPTAQRRLRLRQRTLALLFFQMLILQL
jgi:hypothetical protein